MMVVNMSGTPAAVPRRDHLGYRSKAHWESRGRLLIWSSGAVNCGLRFRWRPRALTGPVQRPRPKPILGRVSIGLANCLTRCLLPAIYSECGEDPKD